MPTMLELPLSLHTQVSALPTIETIDMDGCINRISHLELIPDPAEYFRRINACPSGVSPATQLLAC
jgi:hypothetical protein